MATLFVSDLHLDEARPAATDLFLGLLAGEARQAEAFYILGDLFEAWVGDDEDSSLADAVRGGLRALVESGVPVNLLRGNRDFLIGPRFAAETGIRLLSDPCVALVADEPVLLMHGDLLCTDDDAYQAFRRQVRDPDWQARFLAQPLAARRTFAAQARAASQAHQSGLQEGGQFESIADVVQASVGETMARHGVVRLVHGHTHRPGIHSLRIGGRPANRIVLGDWYQEGSLLAADPDGWVLRSLPA